MQRKIKKKLRTAQISRSKQSFFEHGLGEHGLGESKEWSGCQRSMVNGQRSTGLKDEETKRQRDKESKRQRGEETKRLKDEETKRGRD